MKDDRNIPVNVTVEIHAQLVHVSHMLTERGQTH